MSSRLDRKANVVREDGRRKAKEQLRDGNVELGVARVGVALQAGALGKVDYDGATWEGNGRVDSRGALAVGDLDANVARRASRRVYSDGHGLLIVLRFGFLRR